jgi:hypothetical protein
LHFGLGNDVEDMSESIEKLKPIGFRNKPLPYLFVVQNFLLNEKRDRRTGG